MCEVVRQIGPGPGAYLLPSLVGYEYHDIRKPRGAQYSLGVRRNFKEQVTSPGPGAYKLEQRVTRYGYAYSPAYSLGNRSFYKVKSIGPGPGAYGVEKCKNFRGKIAPAYTMAPRNFKDKISFGPGPDAYYGDVGAIRPGAPAFSIGQRTFLKSRQASPGPAAYNAPGSCVNSPCPPKYTMVGKRGPLRDRFPTPGPNNYNLQGKIVGRRGPQYSFGMRHSCFAPPLVVPLDNC